MKNQKGTYRPHSTVMSIFPSNFDYMPGKIGRRKYIVKPYLLRDLIKMRNHISR